MPALPGSTSRPDIAVIEVDHTGAGTLRLGAEPVDHIVAARPGQIARALLDYAAADGRDVTVLTQYSDGRSAMHEIRTNGTATTLPTPALSARPPTGRPAEHRRRITHRRRWPVGATLSRIRSVVAGSGAAARVWLARHGLWLLLCVQLVMLTGSVTFIAVAPHLWPRP